MKKLLIAGIITVIGITSYAKEIPVIIHNCGTNITFKMNSGLFTVVEKSLVTIKEYDAIIIDEAKPDMEEACTAYMLTVFCGDRYCKVLINCKNASNKKNLGYYDVIERIMKNDDSKKEYIHNPINNYFKIEEVSWYDKNTNKEIVEA